MKLIGVSAFIIAAALALAPWPVSAEEHEKTSEDFSAGPIGNNGEAPAKCNVTCPDHNRIWTGRWTTPQATWGRDSVCGCVHWTYSEAEHWDTLDPAFAECKTGTRQSPIDLPTTTTSSTATNTSRLDFQYVTEALKVMNNGHTVQAIYPAEFHSKLTLDGKTYSLMQFHFHAPSENHIGSEEFAMEGHFVHGNTAGKPVLVVAVMFREGDENAALTQIWNKLPPTNPDAPTYKEIGDYNASSLLPNNLSYYLFDGSLTTPPCGEGIKWVVLSTPVTVSAAQVTAFRTLFGNQNTNRPVQPLNARRVSQVTAP